MRAMMGNSDMSTLKRDALYTCGTRQISAIVTVSPMQYFPVLCALSNSSTATKPGVTGLVNMVMS